MGKLMIVWNYFLAGKGVVNEEASRSSSTSSGVSSIYSNRSSICSTNRNRNSIDDKIASYYPNEDFRLPKKVEPSPPITVGAKTIKETARRPSTKRAETHRTTSPKTSHRKASPQNVSTMPRMSKSPQKPPCHKSRITTRSGSSERSLCPIITVTDAAPSKNSENNPPGPIVTPKLFKKYATIARGTSTSPSKYQEKISARKGADPLPVGNTKRFGSLPRFAKIDLSPLRMKINSVLQRHNSESSWTPNRRVTFVMMISSTYYKNHRRQRGAQMFAAIVNLICCNIEEPSLGNLLLNSLSLALTALRKKKQETYSLLLEKKYVLASKFNEIS